MDDMDQTPDITQDPTLAVPGPIETQTQGATSGSSQTVATPADRQAMAGQFAANQGAAQTQGQVGDAEANKASQLADVQGEDADLYRQQAADAAADHQDYLDRIERARGQQADAEAALKDHKYENYWSKQSTGHKILESLGMAMTGASGNVAAQQAQNEQLQKTISQDFDQQRAEYAQKLDAAKLKGADVNDLYSQWTTELANSKTKEAKAHEAIAAKALEIGTRAGIPVDQLKNHVVVQTMLANAQKARLESQLHFDRSNRTESTRTDSISDRKGAKGPTKDQLEADAAVADMTPDAQSLVKSPLTPDEMKELNKRLTKVTKEGSMGNRLIDGVEDLASKKLTPEQADRVATAQRLVGRLNPLVGEKKTPESDLAVALSRLPTTEDKDSTKADRLLQTIRAQSYRTTNPAAFRKAAMPQTQAAPAAPAPSPAPAQPPAMLARARQAMNDPNAPPAAKRAAAAILSGGQ